MLPSDYAAGAAAIVRETAAAAGRPVPEIVQYVACVARPDRDEARRIVKPPLARMLTAFWDLGDDRPGRREIMVRSSGIPQTEFGAAIARLGRGEAADGVLDDCFVGTFTIAGTATDCLAQAAICRQAGVGELALNFVSPGPASDIQYLGQLLSGSP